MAPSSTRPYDGGSVWQLTCMYMNMDMDMDGVVEIYWTYEHKKNIDHELAHFLLSS